MGLPIITLKQALKGMRDLSARNIPFSFSYISYNEQLQTSSGYKEVAQALLRTGYRNNQSRKANILIAYTDCAEDSPRQFYLPLLMTFNGQKIQP